MTRELIDDMREVILPFVKKVLLKTNYEGLGKSDAKIFERDFNEILNLAIKALEQEPFINKPCVSSGACEHDKNKVLETIRAELHATAEMHEDGDYYLRDEWIDEYFDKYKAEFEPQESERDA